MAEPRERADAAEPTTPAAPQSATVRPRWQAPVLVEYGHLRKLTRGASGNMSDGANMYIQRCL